MLTLKAPMYVEGYGGTDGTIWNGATGALIPFK